LDSKYRVVSNLGFLLQITGLLLVLPIAIGLQNGELQPVASIIATCFIAFGVGFVLNSFCERKELDDKTSRWLMISTFTILPLVLMIPYVWNNVLAGGSPFDLFTNAYFESVSGFTTTGFSFIANAADLPTSLLFYRSLVEFIGGVGFVYILLAFLYPNRRLDVLAQTFGIDRLSDNLKRVFLSVMLIYTLFVVVFTSIFYIVYSQNLIVASCTAIDILTGGYQPNITGGFGIFHISILVLMLLGSTNFSFNYNLFRLKIRNLITPEIKLYLGVIVVVTVIVSILAWTNPLDSLFNVVSMASSTGVETFSIGNSPVAARIAFIIVGLIGGCAFSMAGGIRIQRIQTIVDAVRKKGDQKPTHEELKATLISITSFVIVLMVLSLVFSTIGLSFLDSVFEVSSAITTNGISMGITTVGIPIGYKWLLIFAMIIGRIEIITVLKAIKGISLKDIISKIASFGSEAAHQLRRKIGRFTVVANKLD
jgi:trk/ktr system potassium uptake protein